ncbi:MAG: tRNA (guanosine(37)-N1)-methyltransferase TrmD [Planctomycetes bacterium]|nr:tRNA (guanosine(37)-N1)-methyltransferase TrmD [Planctomycetota bacterium]MBI3835519.1 tRNA (guanosine(37)-N1)-methyltransferase TrmD [Planctomycetota bacterium]
MRIDVLTLFPEAIEPYLASSIVGRAVENGIVELHLANFRDFAHDTHRTVDDRPFGGGPGMVLMCGPVVEAVEHIGRCGNEKCGSPLRIMLTPQGERLTQNLVAELASQPWIVILCGHYEGFDERIRTSIPFREISIGDYVLSGGEPAAMVLIDAMVRLLPGALNDADSAANDSFADGILEYPHYTRPREFRGMTVPEVLLSGDHAKIAAWRRDQSLIRTRERRPDLLDGRPLTQ